MSFQLVPNSVTLNDLKLPARPQARLPELIACQGLPVAGQYLQCFILFFFISLMAYVTRHPV